MSRICLISIDDLRYDGLSCHYENKWADTPNLDSFAKEGTDFLRAYSTASYTPAPHASMLTGLYPNRHKVKTFFYKLPREIKTLPEMLPDYYSVAWVEHPTFVHQDLLRDFDVAYEPLEVGRLTLNEVIDCDFSENTFLFLHLFDVHKPYYYSFTDTEDNYIGHLLGICERQHIEYDKVYDSAMAYVEQRGFYTFPPKMQNLAFWRSFDHHLRAELKKKGTLLEEIIPLYQKGVNNFDRGKMGRILDTIYRADFDLVIITSDHGEGTVGGDYCNITGTTEEGIHVPLLLSEPIGDEEGAENCLVSLVDIAPTILEYLSIEAKGLDGISLFSPDPDRVVYSDTWDYRGITDNLFIKETPTSDFLASACALRGNKKCIKELGEYAGDMELKPALDKYLEGYS